MRKIDQDTPVESLALLLGRLALGAMFVWSGFGKLGHFDGFAQSLAAKGLPAPTLFAVAAVAAEFLGGLAVVLGFMSRLAALVMIAFTIMASLTTHRFWEDPSQTVQFMKNLSIIGGFLLLFARGGGRFGVDGIGHGRR